MPLNIILKCGYDRKFSPEECRKDDASYVVSVARHAKSEKRKNAE